MARKKRPSINLGKPAPPQKEEMSPLFASEQGVEQASGLQLFAIRLNAIQPDPEQPRNTFPPESLAELSDSIRQDGVIQPIEVMQMGPGLYQIVHGERRWRAAQLAGLETIPAIVQRRNYNEVNRFVRQMVENIQREDLNDIDRAHGVMRLRDLMQEELDRAHLEEIPSNEPWAKKITWAKVGKRLGLSRQRISQLMNLLKLPDEIQDSVRDGLISERDARMYQGLKLSQQKALHQTLLVGDVMPAEADQIAKLLKANPNLTVSQAIRIISQPAAEQEPAQQEGPFAEQTVDAAMAYDGEWEEERPLSIPNTQPPADSSLATATKRINYLHWIRTHLARFRTHGLTQSDRDEILRLLTLIQQDIDSLTSALKSEEIA